jgi:hypothetical protein
MHHLKVRAAMPCHLAGPYIFAAGQRVWIRMFRTADEAACAYDVVVWRFVRIRRELNFPEVKSAEEA